VGESKTGSRWLKRGRIDNAGLSIMGKKKKANFRKMSSGNFERKKAVLVVVGESIGSGERKEGTESHPRGWF